MAPGALRLIAVLSVALAGSLQAADELTVEHQPRVIQPGHVVRLLVTGPPTVDSVVATWGDREVPLEHQPDGAWTALIGIDVADAPGARTVRLTARRTAGGGTAVAAHAFTVDPKAVRTRRIRVDPKFVTPPVSALPRIREEAALLNALFRQTSTDRLWTPNAVRPVEGVAVSGFGVRSILNGQAGGPHNGLDLAAATGTPVYAPTAGVIVYARDFYYSGNTIIVDHGQGLYSTMAHLSMMEVREGDRVARGTLLGKVGATGRVTGPHLHWAVRLHGARVDPLSLLDALAPQIATP
jgi:murein DD-endopeptidase MepM/ murein hydrolase activator NlpD